MRLLKQRRLPTIGGLKHMMAQTAMWLSSINFVLIGVTAYNTTLREHIMTVLPGFKLWHFMLIMLVGVAALMFIKYKLIYPSWVAFQNRQEYKHENLLREDLAKIKKALEIIIADEKSDKGLVKKAKEELGRM